MSNNIDYQKIYVPKKYYEQTDQHEHSEQKEDKQIYIHEKNKTNDELGNQHYLNSQWCFWVHNSDCIDWSDASYKHIYTIDSIGAFWRFFNMFHLIDKNKHQIFIMRNKIKPIWEDNANRNGGMCSIKMDCFTKQGRIDTSVEFMTCVCLLVMNETLAKDENNLINGISYSIKNRSVLIKLWCCKFDNHFIDKIPIALLNTFDNELKLTDKYNYSGKKINIRFTPIKPEYEAI